MAVNTQVSTFQETLTLQGTAQQLDPQGAVGAGEPNVASVSIRALKGNGGIIYIGGSAAEATSTEGYELAAGDSVNMDIQTLGKIWFNGTKTGDKVCVIAVGG